MTYIAREDALALLKKYNKDPFHIQHALTVEAVMRWYAKELGYGDAEEYWGIVGLLHDIDFELYPGGALPESAGASERRWCGRGYHSCCGVSWIWNYRRRRYAGCGSGT